jgi:hypothetical protein
MVSNASRLDFDCTVGVSGTPAADGLNLLVDGNDLMEQLSPNRPVMVAFVPEPSGAFLAILGIGWLGLRRRR